MAIAEDKVRLQTVVTKELGEKIDYFAERFEVSQSRMVAIILDACIENEGTLMEICSSAAVKKIVKAFGSKKKKMVIET